MPAIPRSSATKQAHIPERGRRVRADQVLRDQAVGGRLREVPNSALDPEKNPSATKTPSSLATALSAPSCSASMALRSFGQPHRQC